ncbi:unnamed protein product [Choristocarpus tenellus]
MPLKQKHKLQGGHKGQPNTDDASCRGASTSVSYPQPAHVDLEKGTIRPTSWQKCDSEGLLISYASPRGTNRCQACRGSIALGELRFGIIYTRNSSAHIVFHWYHLGCVKAPAELTSPQQLCGIEDIHPNHIVNIESWMAWTQRPDRIKS